MEHDRDCDTNCNKCTGLVKRLEYLEMRGSNLQSFSLRCSTRLYEWGTQ